MITARKTALVSMAAYGFPWIPKGHIFQAFVNDQRAGVQWPPLILVKCVFS